MVKFNVGDGVIIQPERIYGIVAAQYSGFVSVRTTDGQFYTVPIEALEHIAPVVTETELERLVRVANEGYRAIEVLHRHHSSQVEVSTNGGSFDLIKTWNTRCLRIKPKQRPLPEPIYVGPTGMGSNGLGVWKVELSPDHKTVKVGCQEFDAEGLKITLNALCRKGAKESSNVFSIRHGLAYGANTLSWADADRLLAYLEEGLKE